MAKGLQHYTITLITEGPLFIGSGKTIGKKEYIFDARRQLVHIPDLVKMNRFFLERRLEKAYEEYILNDKRDFAAWLRSNQIDEHQYRSWVRYSIDSGDAVFEQRGKKEIATFLKDAYGCPYVPGSSLKGALRTVLLAAEVLNEPDRFRRSRNAVRNAELRPGSKGNLREEKNQLEQGVFHTLNRNEKRKSDAVNDLLCGLRIGDSEPLRVDDLALCQKIDVTRDGVDKRLPILRECIRPETEIRFPLTIDPRYCTLTPQDIMEAANQFVRFYDKCFLEKFPTRDIRGGGNLYLGGGCGYVSKTVTYPLLGEQSVRRVSEIINATLSRTAAIQHKHSRDASRGVSPHMIKCTQYDGQLYEMGACSLEIQ